MNPSTDSRTAAHHLQAAIEAAFGALVTLEAASVQASDTDLDASAVHPLISVARRSLRQAIDELRSAQDETVSMLALGFVAGARRQIR